MAADPNDPRPKGLVQLKLTGTFGGFPAEISLSCPIITAAASVAFLQQQGFAPPPKPLHFDTTPDGCSICPRHGVPMKLREKQGDTWHSHKVVNAAGEELWCKGYAAPDSPGYFVEPETAPPVAPAPEPPPPTAPARQSARQGPPGVRTAPANGRSFGKGLRT